MGMQFNCDECFGAIHAEDYLVCSKCYVKLEKENKALRTAAKEMVDQLRRCNVTISHETQKLLFT